MLRVILLLLAVVGGSRAKNYTCPQPGFPAFSCRAIIPPPKPATDVLHLTVHDISAVMALGDSITATFAAKDLPLEYRGVTYSTGGDADALSIGNFLAYYRPDIKGRAQGTTIPLTKNGKGLNFAVSEARVEDIPGQVQRLAAKLQEAEYRDLQDQWKLLVLFIGANNACDCKRETAPDFQKKLFTAMTLIHQTFPKTFVATMTIFNISGVWDIHSDTAYCDIAVPVLHECGCLNKNATERQMMDDLAMGINAATKAVAAQFAALKDDNFTVSNQPAVEMVQMSKYPKEVQEALISSVDCFHPSLCTHQGMAVGVWNNLFQPMGQKTSSLDPLHPPNLFCPTAKDYLQ